MIHLWRVPNVAQGEILSAFLRAARQRGWQMRGQGCAVAVVFSFYKGSVRLNEIGL